MAIESLLCPLIMQTTQKSILSMFIFFTVAGGDRFSEIIVRAFDYVELDYYLCQNTKYQGCLKLCFGGR